MLSSFAAPSIPHTLSVEVDLVSEWCIKDGFTCE
jgi:hypothetical protein